MPTIQASEAVALQHPALSDKNSTSPPAADYLIYTRPDDSALEMAQISPAQTLGQFPLKGPLNLGGSRPTGLAFSADRRSSRRRHQAGHRTSHLPPIPPRSRGFAREGSHRDNRTCDQTLSRFDNRKPDLGRYRNCWLDMVTHRNHNGDIP